MKITTDKKRLARIQQNIKDAIILAGNDVITDIEEAQIVPKALGILEGTLRPLDISNIDNNIIRIHSNTPYARRNYFGVEFNFHREPWEGGEGNANAQAMWFEPWISGDKAKFFSKRFAFYMERMK